MGKGGKMKLKEYLSCDFDKIGVYIDSSEIATDVIDSDNFPDVHKSIFLGLGDIIADLSQQIISGTYDATEGKEI